MPKERIDRTNDAVERHPPSPSDPNVADCPPQAIGVIVLAAGNADSPSYEVAAKAIRHHRGTLEFGA